MVNPFQSGVDKKKQSDATINKNVRKSQTDTRKATIARSKQVLQNIAKTLAPIVALQLTNVLIQVVNQNGKLQELVNKTNIAIDAASTPIQIEQATILRNSCIQIINNQERKILSLQSTLQTISIIVNFLYVIVNIIGPIILSIPTTPFVDVVTTPKENFRRKVYEPALLLLNSLSVILAVIVPILEIEISNLEDLKSQLHDINGIIDDKSINSGLLSSLQLPFGTEKFPMYKGFKFIIREENDPKFTVRGNKRHYAVAIDRDGVEVLKSDYSFTLDPNDLIEQLKLTIDNKKLQA